MFKYNGDAAENAMRSICKKLFGNYKLSISNSDLINLFIKTHPNRYQIVKECLIKENWFNEFQGETLADVPDWILQDRLLGLDCFFPLKTKSGKQIWIGLDITVNPHETTNKLNKLTKMANSLHYTKIKHCLVVYWNIDKPLVQFDDKDYLKIKKTLIHHIKHLVKSELFVDIITLTL